MWSLCLTPIAKISLWKHVEEKKNENFYCSRILHQKFLKAEIHQISVTTSYQIRVFCQAENNMVIILAKNYEMKI